MYTTKREREREREYQFFYTGLISFYGVLLCCLSHTKQDF